MDIEAPMKSNTNITPPAMAARIPSDARENAVRFITHVFFGGSQANLCREMAWNPTTVSARAAKGGFTADQQTALLEKSDAQGWGIRPAHFFPERLSDLDVPHPKDVTVSNDNPQAVTA